MFETLNATDLFQLAKMNTIPISVLLEVTYKCNEHCIHCYLHEHCSQGMSLQQYETLFDELVNAGTMYLTITGGEPFVRPDFLDIVKAARRRRFSVKIFTNGTLIDENIACELRALHIQEVHISLYDSDPKIHDQITRVPGSFKKTMSSIKLLTSRGVRVRLKCPLMNLTAQNMESIKILARQLDVPVKFFPIITAKNNGDKSTLNLRLSHEQLCRFLLDQDISEQGEAPMCGAKNIKPDAVPCDIIFDGGAIDPAGDVYPCNQLRVRFGNVLSQTFGDIWRYSVEAIALRKITVSDLKACLHCDLFTYCSRCPGLAFLEEGNIFGCSFAAKVVAEGRQSIGVYPSQPHIFSEFKGKEVCLHENQEDIY